MTTRTLLFVSALHGVRFAWVVAVAACGTQSTSDRSPGEPVVPPAVPDGLYDVVGPGCSSTSQTPVYHDLGEPVALHDFDHLLVRTKLIDGDRWVEVYADDDCQLTITGGIAYNLESTYQETRERVHTFVPPGCRLTASYTPPEAPPDSG